MFDQEYFKNKKILITGGSGFIGKELIKTLMRYGAKITVFNKTKIEDIKDIDSFEVDITDEKKVKDLVLTTSPHLIFHLASIVTASRDIDLITEMIDTNLKGTINLLKTIKELNQIEKFIYFGTSEEYGIQTKIIDEKTRELPNSPYAITKLASNRFCDFFTSLFKIPIITIRPTYIYGPAQASTKFIPYIIQKCLKNEQIDMTYGKQKRNFIFVDDFIKATLLVAQKENRLNQIYNIGDENSISLRDLVKLVKKITNSSSKINFGAIAYRENEMMEFNISNNKLKKLGFKALYNLDDGLKLTVRFYQERNFDL